MQVGQLYKLQVAQLRKDGVMLVDEDYHEVFLPLTEMKEPLEKYQYVWVGILKERRGGIKATTYLDSAVVEGHKPATDLTRGDQVSGIVYNVLEIGAFAYSDEGYIVHIPQVEMVGSLCVGQRVNARVTFVREDGRINASLRELKEVARLSDAERILEVLKKRNNEMPYSDETPAEVIKDKFGISKKAFKRALGKLLKDGLVEQSEGWTYLKR